MTTMRIKVQRYGCVDPKQQLRAHIDQLPLEKQREFVATALQLIAQRTTTSDVMGRSGYHNARHEIKQ